MPLKILVFCLLAVGCGSVPQATLTSTASSPQGFPAATTAALDQLLADQVLFTGESGVAMSMAQGAQEWRGAAGMADLEAQTRMPKDARFRVGSHTKMVVTALAMQLVSEGRLTLDARVGDFLPQYDRWQDVTVSQLLSMRAGLPEYLTSPAVLTKIARAPQTNFRPDQLLDAVKRQKMQFEPGTSCVYTNTNFLVVGMILEQVTGQPLATMLAERFTKPFGMSRSFLDMKGETIPGLATGYFDADQITRRLHIPGSLLEVFHPLPRLANGLYEVTYKFHPSLAWAVGGIVSTPSDMVKFMRALMHEALISERTLAAMKDFRSCQLIGETIQYGHGLLNIETAIGHAYGHSGLNLGYATQSYHVPEHDITFSRMSNHLPTQGEALTDEALKIVAGAPGAHQSACKPPQSFVSAIDNDGLGLRFRGTIQESSSPYQATAIGYAASRRDGKRQDYFGVGMKAELRSMNDAAPQVIVTGTGNSFSALAKEEQVELAMPQDALTDLAAGRASFGQAKASLVVRTATDLNLIKGTRLSCVTAIAAEGDGELYTCNAGDNELGVGEPLRLFAKVKLESGVLKIAKYLREHSIPRCECYDKDGVVKACVSI